MKKRTAYHPLRQLIVKGNPNRLRNSEEQFTPPLMEYLKAHKIDYEAYSSLLQNVKGKIVSPFNSEYEYARKESDIAFDKYPLLISYCASVADVVESVKFCNEQNISICIRAGGHNTAGYSVLNGRMLIDVSNIKGINIDRMNMTSNVGAGITWGEYNHELNVYGLHNPGGSCDSVGISGYTLGGGYGYSSMKWGIACDSLLEITMVSAQGEIITANKNSNPELLWAHKGGTGGNFGIVVGLKYQLYSLKEVWPIDVNWPIEDAAKVLTIWQDKMTKTLEDRDLGILGFLAMRELIKKTPDGETYSVRQPYFCIRGIYIGQDKESGRKALQPLINVGKPEYPSGPLWEQQINYASANEHLLDNVEGVIPDTVKETKRCAYVKNPLTEAQYQKIVDFFKTSPSLYNIVSMEPYGGAINEIKSDATAFVHRDAYFDIFTDSFWLVDSEKEEAFRWLKDYYESDKMKDVWSNNYYQNYVNDDYKNWQLGYFGANYKRLQEIKKQWDPQNRFNFPQSIEV